MSRGPTSEIEKKYIFLFFQKFIKLHEMTGNDQKSVWEYHLGAETIHFGDLGCPGRYSGVLEGDFHVDSQNPQVWYGGEMFEIVHLFLKSRKTSRNDWK